jgi:rhodanese-related sulfurtransferase
MKKLLLILIFSFAFFTAYSTAASVSVVSKETLKDWMDSGSVTVLDARQGRDWSSSEFKIQGAHRADPGKLSSWKADFPKDRKLVIYCA